MVQHGPIDRANAEFRTRQLGNYNDANTWEAKGKDGTWYSMVGIGHTPEEGNNIYIRHGVTLTANAKCKGRYIRIDSAMINVDYAINFQTFDLQQYGDHRDYSGDESSMAVFSPTAGIPTLMAQAYLGTGGITIMGKRFGIVKTIELRSWNSCLPRQILNP